MAKPSNYSMDMHKGTYIQNVGLPSGTSVTGIIDLPPGNYWVSATVNTTNASTAGSLAINVFVNAAQTAFVALGSLNGGSAATPLAVPTGAILADFQHGGATMTSHSVSLGSHIPVPYGLQYVYTKGSATAAEITIMAERH